MSDSPMMEAKLSRIVDDLIGVVQAMRLMSDMQRQQSEQLTQIIALLTPDPADPRVDLAGLLAQLIGVVGEMGAQVRVVGGGLERMTQVLPDQMAAAIDEALIRAEKRSVRR